MASIPGGQFAVYGNGETLNAVIATDVNQLPPPIGGEFNLAVITGPDPVSGLPPGYQGVALLSNGGKTVDMAYGNYGLLVTDSGTHTVIGGTGSDTIYASQGNDLVTWRQRRRFDVRRVRQRYDVRRQRAGYDLRRSRQRA